MAVYNVDGEVVTEIYSVNGNLVSQAYDVEGNAVFPDTPGKYGIDNVVEYFRADTLSAASQINALSNDWTNFVFVTDTHGSANKQHSQAIALYLLDNTNAEMIVLNGDYSASNWSKTQYDDYMKPFLDSGLSGKIYATMGNHETYGGTVEAKQCIYNDFLADKTNIIGSTQDIYYYLDDAQKKIRYMFINTSEGGETSMTATHRTWIANNAVLPSSDWSLLVIGHVNLLKMANVTTMNESNGAAIVTAIENCNGTIIGYLCGHQHIDYSEKLGNFQHTTITCDRFENTNYYSGISITNRVAGTNTEQSVSVVSINPKTRNVVIRRVGAGRNMPISYSY